jgi:archaellum component FlaC
MSVCKSVYPTTTTEYTIPTDFTRFLSGDPRENFDRDKLSTITLLNNTLLKNSDLTDYPELKNRIEQGAITDEEFADFLTDKGISLDFVKDQYLKDFPVEIDYNSVKNLVVETSKAITEKIRAGAGSVYGLSSTGLSDVSTVSRGDSGFTFDSNGNVISTNNLLSTTSLSTGVAESVSWDGTISGALDADLGESIQPNEIINTNTSSTTRNSSGELLLNNGADPLADVSDQDLDAISSVTSFGEDTTISNASDIVTNVTLVTTDGNVITINGTELTTENGDTFTIESFDMNFSVTGQGSIPNENNVTINSSTTTTTTVSTNGGTVNTFEGVTFSIGSQTTSVIREVPTTDSGLTTLTNTVSNSVSVNNTIDPNTIFLNNGGLSGIVDLANTTPVDPPAIVNNFQLNDVFDPWNPGRDLRDLFDLQEDYYRQNFSNNFNKQACGSFSNPFGKLIEFVSLVASAKDLAQRTLSSFGDIGSLISNVSSDIGSLINNVSSSIGNISGVLSRISGFAGDIANFTSSISNLVADLERYSDLSGIIKSLTNKLSSFKDQIINQIDSIVGTMKSQISQIQNTVSQLKNIGKGVSKFLNKKAGELTKFFSKDNIDKIKEKAKDFFTLNVQQFEDLLPSVLNFLLLKGCGLASLVENILRGPVDAFQNLASGIIQNFDIMKGYSAEMRNAVLSIGGLRMTVEEREANKKKAIENANGRRNDGGGNPGTPVLSDYVKPDITDDERREAGASITKDGWPGYFNFKGEEQVITMGSRAKADYEKNKNNNDKVAGVTRKQALYAGGNFHDPETGDDSGFKDVQTDVWVMFKRVIERLQKEGVLKSGGELTVNSAYRSKYYNYFVVGVPPAAKSSRHMEGRALDVRRAALGGDRGEAAFIQACSEEGFIRIVPYEGNKPFIHIDVGPGNRSSLWTSKNNWGKQALAAWERHSTGSKSSSSPSPTSPPKPKDIGGLVRPENELRNISGSINKTVSDPLGSLASTTKSGLSRITSL